MSGKAYFYCLKNSINMFRTIKSILFSLLLVAGLASCDKEVSEENGGGNNSGGTQSGTAVYTIDGSPLACSTPLISGDYVVGTALDISNTVTLAVTVTTVGTYTISTGVINGIQFVGSGTFPGTGPQTITLFGTGTPVAAITSSFEPGINNCTFYITATTSVITPVGGIFYDAIIDGTHYQVDVDGTNDYVSSSTLIGTTDDVTLGSVITTATQPLPTGKTAFRITKGILHSYSSASNVTFKAFFSVGSYPYGFDPVDGVTIYWTDETGVEWSTKNAPGTQAGSNFSVIAVADEPGQAHYTVRVSGTFNCTLYNPSGASKTLTDGTFVMLFSKL